MCIRDSKYIAQPSFEDVTPFAESREELKEELEDILDYEISLLKQTDENSLATYETLERVFGSETLAEIDQEKPNGTWFTVSLEKVATINEYYLIVDDQENPRAIQL